MSDVREAKARLREGTEVLRTGGGVHLTASECNVLLDEFEDMEAELGRLKHEKRILMRELTMFTNNA